MSKEKSAIVIGSGFAGLSAASFLAKAGWKVTVIEKNNSPGGRARQLTIDGFVFDMGPSFYWMPDVFERYFKQFGKKASDYYALHRIDPSYRVYWNDAHTDVPADFKALKNVFESIEPGSGERLEKYLLGAAYKYRTGINKLVYKPGLHFSEFLDWDIIRGVFKLDVFRSIKKHIARYFKHPHLRQLMEFPVLFLGALPEDTPALYSLMNYADIKGGTWYPQGGMYTVVNAMYKLASELGVKFRFNEAVTAIEVKDGKAGGVRTAQALYTAEVVVSGADYHFTETSLLPPSARSYTDHYWTRRVMAPSCLLYYVGLNKRLKTRVHHSLFFDVPFDEHSREIYKTEKWPANPLFYVSMASVTDATVAPEGCDNLVFLVPVASGLKNDTIALRDRYFKMIVERMERHTGEEIKDAIRVYKTYSVSDFVHDYNSFRGNAYGLANTLAQTAVFRPACRSKKIQNLFYTGQLTVPGPGVPPCLISGEVVATEITRKFK